MRRILVVDDEQDIGTFVCDVAGELGFEAHATTKPQQLKSLYQDMDVIVLDLAMPGVDGVELLRFLADAECRSSLILMSGLDQGILQAVKQLGTAQGLSVIGSLAKPIRIADLEQILDSIPETADLSDLNRVRARDNVPGLEELRRALENDQFLVYFQPQVSLTSGALIGVETLVRWQHPERGLLPPAEFIPEAEQSKLIDRLTHIVLIKALEQARLWKKQQLSIQVSINISAQTLTRLDLPELISGKVQEYGLQANQICIEITESALMEELIKSLDILTRLRMRRFHLAIDDFGTGYSSMQQLQRVPFTEMKIDQSFIQDADSNDESRAIVESTIELGHKLGMPLVAEGIESETAMGLLRDLGCETAQGYHIGRPMPAEEFRDWHEDWKRGL